MVAFVEADPSSSRQTRDKKLNRRVVHGMKNREGIEAMESYVLVVDDQADIRQLIVDLLDSMSIPGRQAANGQQALQVIRENRPSAIILDIMMPVMNGFTLLSHLQSDKDNRAIPIILLSGIADNTPKMRNLPGVISVIRKGGFSINELRTALTQAMGTERIARDPTYPI
jgi:CheY-like chemotaxis protein